jgi:hypothetical protein
MAALAPTPRKAIVPIGITKAGTETSFCCGLENEIPHAQGILLRSMLAACYASVKGRGARYERNGITSEAVQAFLGQNSASRKLTLAGGFDANPPVPFRISAESGKADVCELQTRRGRVWFAVFPDRLVVGLAIGPQHAGDVSAPT